jgi:hypothetical protein
MPHAIVDCLPDKLRTDSDAEIGFAIFLSATARCTGNVRRAGARASRR